jgi:hypothetical protein
MNNVNNIRVAIAPTLGNFGSLQNVNAHQMHAAEGLLAL